MPVCHLKFECVSCGAGSKHRTSRTLVGWAYATVGYVVGVLEAPLSLARAARKVGYAPQPPSLSPSHFVWQTFSNKILSSTRHSFPLGLLSESVVFAYQKVLPNSALHESDEFSLPRPLSESSCQSSSLSPRAMEIDLGSLLATERPPGS